MKKPRSEQPMGTDYLSYRLSLETGTLRCLAAGQFLTWMPDDLHFCTALGRDTMPYEKHKVPYPIQYYGRADAQYRTVWCAPLYVRATAGGPIRQLTPRLFWVIAADWRKGN